MDRNSLFVEKVRDLAQIVQDPEASEYRLLTSSALLRTLLLDESPLVHQVNRQRKKRIRFFANAEDAYTAMVLADRPTHWFFQEGISPRLAVRPRATTETLKLDNWLAKRAAQVHGTDVSVKALILQVAHVEGGVHAGTPKTELEKLLNTANMEFKLGGVGAVARTLRGIGDVTLAALQPLCPPGSVPTPDSAAL